MSKVTVPRKSGDEYREEARRERERERESFDRCDTDGFLSQWAHSLSSQHDAKLATLADTGGLAEFDALFDLAGASAPAKIIETRYGARWAVFASVDDALRRNGRILEWLPYRPARASTLISKGFREGTVRVSAGVTYAGNGRGLSGASSVYIRTVRLDDGFSPDVEIVDNGIEQES